MPAFLTNPLIVYAFTLFTSALLLFLVQPMIGKMILPKFGGTPMVWNSTMMFFQASLLAGYLYAHLVSSRLGLRRQIVVHFVVVTLPLIAFVAFPLGVAYKYVDPPAEGNPAISVVSILTMLIGLPFLIVSTSAPLLQRWFSHSGHPAARDPYFLYAASNLGSMASLVLYPTLVEPYVTLPFQGIFWMVVYGMLLVMTIYSGYMVFKVAPPDPVVVPKEEAKLKSEASEQITGKRPLEEHFAEKPAEIGASPEAGVGASALAEKTEEKSETAVGEQHVALKGAKRWRKREKAKAETQEAITRAPASLVGPALDKKPKEADLPELAGQPTFLQQLRWVALGFVPSSLMLGVTMYMSTDIAAIPLLWIIPLALYLLSFILVFSRLPAWVHYTMVMCLPIAILLLSFTIIASDFSFGPILGVPPIILKFMLNLVNLFVVAMVCHGELARSRPAAQYLTVFYLLMSVGGMLGGVFNGLIATVLFNSVAEYTLVLAIACMLLPPMELDTKSVINRWIDNALATLIICAGIYVVLRWYALVRAGIAEGDPIKISQFLLLPGVKPGVIADLMLALLLLGPLVYVVHRRYKLAPRLLDVVLPLGLFLLTAELLRSRPFDTWNFNWLITVAKQIGFHAADQERMALALTCGLPVALCYGFAEKPIRFGLGVGAMLLGGAYYTHQEFSQDKYGRVTKIMTLDRTFFGVLKVEESGVIVGGEYHPTYHRLLHGTTLHGMQRVGLDDDEPLTYYHRTGPVGLAYQAMFSGVHAKDPVAFIGLGTGTMASYCNTGQTVTFYEIDQSVVDIAENPRFFTYLQNCKNRGGNYEFKMGDARLRMRDAPDHTYRMIVVDAFSSDAIPVHLITLEAVELYFQKLTEDGIACIHISNRYLELGPVLGNIAKKLDLAATRLYDGEEDLGNQHLPGKNRSDWVMLARKPVYLQPLRLFDRLTSFNKSAYQLNEVAALLQPGGYMPILVGDPRWTPLEGKADVGLWTDDFSNILSIFRWH